MGSGRAAGDDCVLGGCGGCQHGGVDTEAVRLREASGGAGAVCAQILASLPAWFGIEESNRAYAEAAERSPVILADAHGDTIGLLVVARHSPASAELHLLAVRPEWHRHGVGRRLVGHAERTLAADGVRYLQVKTLSDRHPDAGYAATRAFYRACGFEVLEELPTLWDPANPALQLVKGLPDRRHPAAGGVHHLELWVADLEPAADRWGWLLGALGYEPFQDWPAGRSWRRGGHYVVLERPAVLQGTGHDRCRPGLNHVAFHAGRRADLDALVAAAADHGWNLLFADRHPFAGGPDHYAAYLEDPDGFEVELVARPED
jgi:ribosomal protein S18 acetylase RimI-like enzyme/catechol 2,3-dioxygenase-like lactoylglutathione lyase family enzyme